MRLKISSFKKIVLSIAIFLGCLVGASFLSLLIVAKQPNKLKDPMIVLIRPGYSTLHIADLLAKNYIIINKWLFVLYVKTIGSKHKLIAGEYEFLPKLSLQEVIPIISKGESIMRQITIPEGLTTQQIVKLLNEEIKLAGTISTIPKEGTLFPDTYNFKYGDNRSKIIKIMEEKMHDILKNLQPKISLQGQVKNIDELLVLASIVEKEAGNDAEKPLVASVFLNRLKINMKLQADPTVIYGITMGRNNLNRQLLKKDLETNTPYNTYTNLGLPPTAIACPGLRSLEAVLNPAKTTYLYFVVKGRGEHNFSSSLQEHNSHVKNYRIIQKNSLLTTKLKL